MEPVLGTLIIHLLEEVLHEPEQSGKGEQVT